MGAFDWLGHVGDWLADRWNEDWSDFSKTFTDSWKSVPDSYGKMIGGLTGMMSSPFSDDAEFFGSARLWADNAINLGKGLMGGTLGTVFQIPVLHEISWLLDKTYRYAIARPIATQWLWNTNRMEALAQGASPSDMFRDMLDFDKLRQAWNQSEYVTPGQAIVYYTAFGSQLLGDDVTGSGHDESLKWYHENDPRTRAGQRRFNSEDANFWLKYSSGTLDFVTNILADPGHGASALSKMARLRLIDKVADDRYIMAGKVNQEIGTSNFEKVKDVFRNASTPEEARDLTIPTWRKGGQASNILWAASRKSDDVFSDAWLTMRAFDVDAFKRLRDNAPDIAADFADMFANHTIADLDYRQGQVLYGMGADALRETKLDAFIDSWTAMEGTWGKSLGLGVGEKMPRVSPLSKMRAGYHSYVLNAPIIIGRPLANLMPSQGWTARIDAMDGTGLALKQFKANLERAQDENYKQALSPESINNLVSRYGRATSDATRSLIASQAETRIVAGMLKEFGISKKDLPKVLAELNKFRAGQKRLVSYEKRFISEKARERAEAHAAAGRNNLAAQLYADADEYERAVNEGLAAGQYFADTDVDGRLNLVPVDIDPSRPQLRSQFAETINMLDYRALRAGLRQWKLSHPDPKSGLWSTAFGKHVIANAYNVYRAGITAADSINSAWKASALLRPAQAPRNVASDVALAMIQFGKLPLLMGAAKGLVNTVGNISPRLKNRYQQWQEFKAKFNATGEKPTVDAADTVVAPQNVTARKPDIAEDYDNWGDMFADGAMSLQAYANGVEQAIKDGAPVPLFEHVQYQTHMVNSLNPAAFKRNLALAALGRAKRDKFRQKPWRQGILRDVINRHLNRREAEGYEDNPYEAGTLVVDPFTGLQPHTLAKDLRANFDIEAEGVLPTRDIPKKKAGSAQSVAVGESAAKLEQWIADNADELLKPNTLLSLRVRPDGNISVGFARAKTEAAAREPVGVSAKRRVDDYAFTDIKDAPHTGLIIKHTDGTQTDLGAVFGGEIGQQLQRRVSARTNPSVAFQSLIDVDLDELSETGVWDHPITPFADNYPESWERAVNAQLASDPIAARFIEGKSLENVTDWVANSGAGRKWVRALGYAGNEWYDRVAQIESMVNTYLPQALDVEGNISKEALALRQSALNKSATHEQLERAIPDQAARPEVHGASVQHVLGNSRSMKWMSQQVRQLQKVMSDMPVDKWARFPFMAQAYKRHGTMLANVAKSYYKDGPVPAEMVNLIKEAAREKAYYDVRYNLYDTAQRNDFAYATRMFIPFSSAMMDSYIKYGRQIRQNPMLLVQGAYYWDLFEREGMVQDQDGNVATIEDGSLRWYHIDPKTGEKTLATGENVGKNRYIQFQLPDALQKALGRKYYGVDAKPVFSVNKDTMNVFLNTPSGGPLVAFPANEFALSHPDFGIDEKTGEDTWAKKFFFPYGPTTERSKTLIPPNVRNALDLFKEDDGNLAAGQAAAIMQAELIGYSLGTRDEPPTFKEVREKAAGLRFLRFATGFVSPASFTTNSPYKPYVDAYRQLREKEAVERRNGNTEFRADEEFQKRYGAEFYAVMLAVTRNNSGLSASLESAQAYTKYQDMIQMYPELGGLIVGAEGGGAFNKSVYEAQKEMALSPGSDEKMRERMSLSESVEDLEKRRVWSDFSKLMDLIKSSMVDRGLTSLEQGAAKDLKAAKQAFIEKNKLWIDPATGAETLSPWYMDYTSTDRGKVERKFEALTRIVQDDRLRQRDDIQGLAEYMNLRRDTLKVMERYGFRTLDSKQARRLRLKWDRQVHDLVESNPAFGALWNRWLENDKLDIAREVRVNG